MIELSAAEDATILNLSPGAPQLAVETALKAIASARPVDWRGWPGWKASPGHLTLFSWTALQFDSGSYEALAAFAFGPFLAGIQGPMEAAQLFDAFSKSLRELELAVDDESDAERAATSVLASNRLREAIESAFIAAGPLRLAMAHLAIRGALSKPRSEWLASAWRAAEAKFARDEIDAVTATAAPSAGPGTP